jgi:hypothetical protein
MRNCKAVFKKQEPAVFVSLCFPHWFAFESSSVAAKFLLPENHNVGMQVETGHQSVD